MKINIDELGPELAAIWDDYLKPLLEGEAQEVADFIGEVSDEFMAYARMKAAGDSSADKYLTNLAAQVRLIAAKRKITLYKATWDAVEQALQVAGKVLGVFLRAAVGI